MKRTKFAEHVFVRLDDDGDGGLIEIADRQPSALVEDDGPTVIGTYQLVEVKALSKRLVSHDLTAPRAARRSQKRG